MSIGETVEIILTIFVGLSIIAWVSTLIGYFYAEKNNKPSERLLVGFISCLAASIALNSTLMAFLLLMK